MGEWVLFAIGAVALTSLGAISIAYAGAGRGNLRGHAGEFPALAGAVHLVGLFAAGADDYAFFVPHLAIVAVVLTLAVVTIDRRRDDSSWLITAVRVAYAMAYSIAIGLVFVDVVFV